ncbi:MAG TPA: Tn3 family transposase [Alphaproteobacteria bacterium]|nr:Tn3 family transposase [Alphaproteobacteria bacterium]
MIYHKIYFSNSFLYCSSKSQKENYPNLTDALSSEGVAWRKIEENYQEIIKHALALKLKIVEPEVMLRRLSANNKENPVYPALLELGKATRTIFLCCYLSCEELRIEIGEALNVVERVNGLMNFIFYGRLGEISTNKKEDQELSILCLHLLQACMAYVTTILIQTTLSDPKWEKILTTEDKRALSPLFHGHINPYGLLSLDMDERLIKVPPIV